MVRQAYHKRIPLLRFTPKIPACRQAGNTLCSIAKNFNFYSMHSACELAIYNLMAFASIAIILRGS